METIIGFSIYVIILFGFYYVIVELKKINTSLEEQNDILRKERK